MTNEQATMYFKRHLNLYCIEGKPKEAEEKAIQAFETLKQINEIINSPIYIQEDVLKYQMICEVMKNDK